MTLSKNSTSFESAEMKYRDNINALLRNQAAESAASLRESNNRNNGIFSSMTLFKITDATPFAVATSLASPTTIKQRNRASWRRSLTSASTWLNLGAQKHEKSLLGSGRTWSE